MSKSRSASPIPKQAHAGPTQARADLAPESPECEEYERKIAMLTVSLQEAQSTIARDSQLIDILKARVKGMDDKKAAGRETGDMASNPGYAELVKLRAENNALRAALKSHTDDFEVMEADLERHLDESSLDVVPEKLVAQITELAEREQERAERAEAKLAVIEKLHEHDHVMSTLTLAAQTEAVKESKVRLNQALAEIPPARKMQDAGVSTDAILYTSQSVSCAPLVQKRSIQTSPKPTPQVDTETRLADFVSSTSVSDSNQVDGSTASNIVDWAARSGQGQGHHQNSPLHSTSPLFLSSVPSLAGQSIDSASDHDHHYTRFIDIPLPSDSPIVRRFPVPGFVDCLRRMEDEADKYLWRKHQKTLKRSKSKKRSTQNKNPNNEPQT